MNDDSGAIPPESPPAKNGGGGAWAPLAPEVRRHLRDQLRSARAQVHQDAEAFGAVAQVIERIGRLVGVDGHGMGDAKGAVVSISNKSSLAMSVPNRHPSFHMQFARLYGLVQELRNAAVHEGALARNLTARSIELALVLEDALMHDAKFASDYMVRGPVTAEPWQPLSFIRQTMLAHSYSYLPVLMRDSPWQLVADHSLASYLGSGDRKRRLRETLEEATGHGLLLLTAETVNPDHPLHVLQQQMGPAPTLVVRNVQAHGADLLGILTAFDLL